MTSDLFESEPNLTEISAISTRDSEIFVSPNSKLEMHKCKSTLSSDKPDTHAETYYPLLPIKGSAMQEWELINQELVSRGLPPIHLPSCNQESHLEANLAIPGDSMESIATVIADLLQESSDQKSELQSQKEIAHDIKLYLKTQKQEIEMLREVVLAKDKIIEQLNRKCSILNESNAQFRGELDGSHIAEIQDIVEENRRSKQELKDAHLHIRALGSEIASIKASQADSLKSKQTNPFLQPDVCSRTFDQEELHLESRENMDRTSQLFDLPEKKESSKEVLHQIGSFIKLLCNELGVDTIAELYLAIRSMNAFKQESESVIIPVFEECVQIMNSPSLPNKFRPQSYERVTLKGFVELIGIWADELSHISSLQEVLKQLTSFAKESCVQQGSECLTLWNLTEAKESEEWSILEMSEFIKLMFLTPGSEKLLSLEVLQGLFSHFSKLFKIHEPVNMLTLMSDFQSRFEEMDNVLRVCKVAIGLKEDASNSTLINSIHNIGVSDSAHILPTSAFDQIELLERVKFYENFFFHFEWIISKLFKLLSVEKLSEVIPRVELLTQDT